MSTQIQVLPKSGITIGTTPITSGTVGRVLFEGAGNVVQEDAGFLFDSVNKSLTNYGKGGITSNTSFGLNASQSNTIGANNVSIGFEALKNNLTGGFTTAIGYTALRDMTGIGYSTAIGWGAGIGITSGHTNTLLGYGAGGGITTGNNNTIIGVNIATLAAGTLNNVILADGGGNIAIKKDANHFVGIGYSATATLGAKLDVRAQGALSTDIAFRVRNSADTRNFLTVNGAGDVFNNGAGGVSTNTFFGENVGRNASGIRNTAFGNQSLLSNTTGVNNIALGTFAAYSNTTGVNNIGIGVQSLNSNSISSNNVALGNQSLFTNTAGENTALGNNSLYSNTTGTQNSSVGYQSSYSNSTGQQNIALGTFAMYSNTTGSNNVSLGVQSLNNKTFGSSNIALGFDSGRRISGGGNLTTANNSIFIGEDSRANADSQTNQIVIGHNAIGGGSNTATLGNTSIVKTILRGTINAANLPTSATGLVTGDIWNNGGVLNIV